MKTSRRALLRSAALGAGALVSCERVVTRVNRDLLGQGVPDKLTVTAGAEVDPDFHLLSRAAFGPWPGEVQRLKKMGREE